MHAGVGRTLVEPHTRNKATRAGRELDAQLDRLAVAAIGHSRRGACVPQAIGRGRSGYGGKGGTGVGHKRVAGQILDAACASHDHNRVARRVGQGCGRGQRDGVRTSVVRHAGGHRATAIHQLHGVRIHGARIQCFAEGHCQQGTDSHARRAAGRSKAGHRRRCRVDRGRCGEDHVDPVVGTLIGLRGESA